jgi:hypothetical protein
MDADFKAIREGLRQLGESKAKLKVFGSEAHKFHTHPPLIEPTVREFETRHQVVLPPEYGGFLIHVGNGGAGPAYGIFKLGEMDDGFGLGAPEASVWSPLRGTVSDRDRHVADLDTHLGPHGLHGPAERVALLGGGRRVHESLGVAKLPGRWRVSCGDGLQEVGHASCRECVARGSRARGRRAA